MATEITMPKLSDTMTEGRLISWKKGVGDHVERGEIIAEVETDKANMELEAFVSGVLLETRIKAGEMAPVGAVMAVVGAAGEAAPTQPSPPEPDTEKAVPAAVPTPVTPLEPEAPPGGQPPSEKQAPTVVTTGDVPEGVAAEAGGEKASPLVRRLAREKGIDLGKVAGSGPEGRILKEDIETMKKAQAEVLAEAEKTQTASVIPAAAVVGAVQPLSRMRAAIARTVAEAWRSIPHFSVTMAIDMGEAERVRMELKEAGTPLSLNDLIVKAAALAINKFPVINASFREDGILRNEAVNIGIAVALDDGLLVPVIMGCQTLSLREIALRSRDLIDRARSGRISDRELSGGTFSISNLGTAGVEEFTAVIHPRQGAILAVGMVADQPMIKGGHLAAARIMRVTLSADHRLIDGAYGAKFLGEVKRVLENPVTMLL